MDSKITDCYFSVSFSNPIFPSETFQDETCNRNDQGNEFSQGNCAHDIVFDEHVLTISSLLMNIIPTLFFTFSHPRAFSNV